MSIREDLLRTISQFIMIFFLLFIILPFLLNSAKESMAETEQSALTDIVDNGDNANATTSIITYIDFVDESLIVIKIIVVTLFALLLGGKAYRYLLYNLEGDSDSRDSGTIILRRTSTNQEVEDTPTLADSLERMLESTNHHSSKEEVEKVESHDIDRVNLDGGIIRVIHQTSEDDQKDDDPPQTTEIKRVIR